MHDLAAKKKTKSQTIPLIRKNAKAPMPARFSHFDLVLVSSIFEKYFLLI